MQIIDASALVGRFLIASPDMCESTFSKAVIFLCKHGKMEQ